MFNVTLGYIDMPVTVPCGQCIGCRLEKSRQWAMRLVHEAQLHEQKCFITLTYDNAHLPQGGTLVKKHFQDFMKRLRKPYGPGAIRYFHCGEYGEITKRPHYHACLFGTEFIEDKRFHTRNAQGDTIYTSERLESTWGMGFCTIGNFTFETAAYVARYILKKVSGPTAPKHYRQVDLTTGETIERIPEYVTMSLKPAISSAWFDAFSADVYPDDFCVMRGKKLPVPRYYDLRLGRMNKPLLEHLKKRRIANGKKNASNSTHERLHIRETVKLAQIKSLKRSL